MVKLINLRLLGPHDVLPVKLAQLCLLDLALGAPLLAVNLEKIGPDALGH